MIERTAEENRRFEQLVRFLLAGRQPPDHGASAVAPQQMLVTQSPGPGTFIDVLERVLDRGIIIDAWMRVSLSGIDLVTREARIVVASIETYLENAAPLGRVRPKT